MFRSGKRIQLFSGGAFIFLPLLGSYVYYFHQNRKGELYFNVLILNKVKKKNETFDFNFFGIFGCSRKCLHL